MEGRSLIDCLAGWGPNSAEVLSGHPAAHPRNKSSLDQPVVASWLGWPSVQVQARYIRRPGLAFLTRAAAERTHFDWLLVACAPVLPGMALKRERAIAALAVRQSWQQFLGRGGPNQALIKGLPGSRPARPGPRRAYWPTGWGSGGGTTRETGLGDRDE